MTTTNGNRFEALIYRLNRYFVVTWKMFTSFQPFTRVYVVNMELNTWEKIGNKRIKRANETFRNFFIKNPLTLPLPHDSSLSPVFSYFCSLSWINHGRRVEKKTSVEKCETRVHRASLKSFRDRNAFELESVFCQFLELKSRPIDSRMSYLERHNQMPRLLWNGSSRRKGEKNCRAKTIHRRAVVFFGSK